MQIIPFTYDSQDYFYNTSVIAQRLKFIIVVLSSNARALHENRQETTTRIR